ncbi:MAG: response regulator transcription factor [Gemmatimonadota bacterium]
MTECIRIILADDHPILRSGLKALLELEPEMKVVGEGSTGEQAVERAASLRPDVVIMDLEMPGIGGLEATRQIRALGYGTKVLVLTSHAEADFLLPVLDAGGSGFVQKTNVQDDLLEAIRVVARDEVFLYPHAVGMLLQGYRSAGRKREPGPLDELSERERDVLSLTAEGYSATEIGRKLFLSPKTVETYRSRLMHKLNLHHRADLIRFALRTGILREEAKEPAICSALR